jgi:hypothetical protein
MERMQPAILHLVITNSQGLQPCVIRDDFFLEFNNARVVFVVCVALDKAPVKLDDPGQRQLCTLSVVKTTDSLNDLIFMYQ